MRTQRKDSHWVQEYLICFTLGFGILILLNLLRQGTMFWGVDGVVMYHTTASYAKTFWLNLLQGTITVMDFTVGEGLNPILHMTYYGLLEPWNLLYVITPDSWTPTVYTILLFARILLSGLAFGWYAQRHSQDHRAISVGAITYVFSGYFLFWTQGPVLLNAGFLLPLLVGYMEESISKQKHIQLGLVTALAYITNYYVAIVLSCILLIYGILYLSIHRLWKQWNAWVWTVISHASGILISGIIFVPCALYIFNGMRIGECTGYNHWLVYPWQYYVNIIQSLFAPASDNALYWQHPYQSQTNVALITLPAIFTLYTASDKTTKLMKWSLIIAGVMLCVPAFGRLLNGNAYTTNRWTIALSFVISMITVWAIPHMQLSTKQKIGIWLYILISSGLGFLYTLPTVAFLSAILLVLIGLLLTTVSLETNLKKLMRLSVIGTMLISMVFSQYISTFVTQNQLINSDYYQILNKPTNISQRVSQTDNLIGVNTGVIHQKHTNTSAWNVISTAKGEYYNNIQAMPNILHPTWAIASDDRSSIQVLSATRYYITTDTRQAAVPVGFQYLYTTQRENEALHVYKNINNPGVGYVFTKTLSTDVFEHMNIAEKQAALMQYAIIENGDTVYQSQSLVIPHTESREGESIAMTLNVPNGYELYLCVNNVEKASANWELLPTQLVSNEDDTIYDVQVVCSDADDTLTKYMSAWQPNAHLQTLSGLRTMCLGHQMQDKVTVHLKYSADVTIGEIQFYAIPTDALAATSLTKNAMYDVTQEGSVVSGKVNTANDGVLQISIPYDEGWKVYIDGTQAETFTSGIKYIGVNLSAGAHEIKLEYQMIGMREGVIASCLGIITLLVIGIIQYKKRNPI